MTAEGQVLHKKANEGPDESRPGVRILRALPVASERYNLTGICDVVEARGQGARFKIDELKSITPLEYKRGKPKSHRADEVQVCAQVICLEEMFQIEIPLGLIYYGEKRRRTEVPIDAALRALTISVIEKTHALFATRLTPQMDYLKGRCANCSLLELCMPKRKERQRSAASWFEECLTHQPH